MGINILLFGSGGYIGKYLSNNIKSNVIPINRDMCDLFNIDNLREVLNKYPKIDAIVNCVGKVTIKSFDEYTSDDVDELISKNLITVYNLLKVSIPIFRKQGEGRFINISSIRGITGAPNKTIYTASKFAVQGLIDSLRLELKETNIKLTNICPGRLDDTVTREDIAKTINYLLSLSDKTHIRNIILGGQL
jgi:short-subunit dehydrogenase